MKLLLKGGRVVDPAIEMDDVLDVLIEDGVFLEVAKSVEAPKGAKVIDCEGMIVTPGLLDLHTHLREPGSEYKETIATGTAAAAHGGFSAVAAMPNTKPVIDDGAAVRALLERAADTAAVQVYAIGAITKGQQGTSLAEMADMAKMGALAFSDDGRGIQDPLMMRRALEYAKVLGKPLFLHEEEEALLDGGCINEGLASTRLGIAGAPALCEYLPIQRDIEIARFVGDAPIHFCHISTKEAVEAIRAAKAAGLPVTAEVTPHHLFLTEDDLGPDYNTNLKMNPPLRTEADRQALIEGLLDGTIDAIATDHAPHAPQEKQLEFELAANGTVGLETALPLVLTHLVAPGIMSWAQLVRAFARRTREILGLPIIIFEAGEPAEVTVIDPGAEVTVSPEWLVGKSKNSAFLGQTLTGAAREVYARGELVLEGGKLVGRGAEAALRR
ncbi:MAG: dihydroorotase [Actinomycetia bacterium]|nr:dihydroorotase [Actinomycetes bacterium]